MNLYSLFIFTLSEVSTTPPTWLTEEWIGSLIKFAFAIILVVITGVWSVKKFFVDNKIDGEHDKEKSGQSIIINQNPQQNQYTTPTVQPYPQPQYIQPSYYSQPTRPLQEDEIRQLIQITYDGILKGQKEHSDRVEKEYETKISNLNTEIERLQDIEKERNDYKNKCEDFALEIKRINGRYDLSKDVMINTKNSLASFLENTGPIRIVTKN